MTAAAGGQASPAAAGGQASPAAAWTSSAPPGHYRFGQIARMEWIKLRTLRSTLWSLLLALAGMVGIGIAAGFNTRNARGDVTNNILAGVALGQVVFAVLGVLVVTSEYSSGTIRATLTAIPRRPLVLAAKASVFAVVTLAAGELASVSCLLAGAAFVRAGVPHPTLGQPAVLRAVALSGAYLSLIGLIGLALGAIIRHGAFAIAALLALVFVAPLAGLAQTPAGRYLPELIYANSMGATQPVSGFDLSPWAGLGIICAYAAVLLAAAGWLLTRRDV